MAPKYPIEITRVGSPTYDPWDEPPSNDGCWWTAIGALEVYHVHFECCWTTNDGRLCSIFFICSPCFFSPPGLVISTCVHRNFKTSTKPWRHGAEGNYQQSPWNITVESVPLESPWTIPIKITSNPIINVFYWPNQSTSIHQSVHPIHIQHLMRFIPWKTLFGFRAGHPHKAFLWPLLFTYQSKASWLGLRNLMV